jgi:hypothetical protein
MPTSYLLKVTLLDTEKPIWRRFVVPSDIPLDELSDAILRVMGFLGYHLHEFEVGRKNFFPAEAEISFGLPEEEYTLADIAPRKGAKFLYRYDFGDRWEHRVVVEDCDYSNPDWPYSIYCLEGERACPPEDCGGTWGYAAFCEAMMDETHPEHEQQKEWYGEEHDPEDFDPEKFDMTMANWILGIKPRSE